jgi:hypothetical protein
MRIVSFNGDGTATLEFEGETFTLAVAGCGMPTAGGVVTPALTGSAGTVIQAVFPLMGDDNAQRLAVHALVALGRYGSMRSAATALQTYVALRGGVLHLDPVNP